MWFKRMIGSITLGMFVLFCAHSPAFGADMPSNEELLKELKQMRMLIKKQGSRIEALEKQLNDQNSTIAERKEKVDAKLKTLAEKDISGRMKRDLALLEGVPGELEIGAGITFVGQGTPNANNAAATDGEDSRFDGSYSIDLEVAKEFGDYGMAFIHMEAGQGDTIEGELSVFSNVNRDAGDSNARVDITEAWYEQYIFDGQLTITGGKIDATGYIDTNKYANDECTQFLGHIFRNSAVIDWPDDNAFGARIYIVPEEVNFIDLEAVYMNETGDWENLFDNPFLAAQLNFMPAKAFDYDEEMWGGNYRVLFWYNGAPHAKVKDTDDFERGNVGFGFTCDQKITDVYGVFGRFGWADPTKSDLGYDWSIGGQMIGRYWNREDDVVAIAIGQAIPGKEYRDVNVYDKSETHLEAYYAFKVNDHLTLTPDMQIIWEPNGGGTTAGKDSDTIFVYGLRGQIDF
ncbi:MAG: carbohydrate porin [Candidatus Omnitrophica bacterium]|nr:carbohydrate porin [Candidatus Omnitrophota bacterium]